MNTTSKKLTNAIDWVSITSPIIAPCIPAWMAGFNMFHVLNFPLPIAFLGAIAVEFTGIATTHTYFTLRDYNLNKNKSEPTASLKAPLMNIIIYFTVILLVNVVIDDSILVQRIAKALLSILTAVGAINWSVRSNHNKRLEENEFEKKKRSEKRAAGKANKENQLKKQSEQSSKQLPELSGNRQAIYKQLREKPDTTQKEIAEKLGITRQAVGNHVRKLEQDGYFNGNGHSN